MIGKFDNKIIAKAVKALNVHLPAERRTLLALLKEDKPTVQGRDGSLHRMKRGELEEIASFLPEEAHGRLRLPIYIELTPDYGRGIAKVHGKLDCEIVRRILGEGKEGEGEKEQEGEGSGRVDEIFIYRDDVRKLRRRLPTTTEYAFFYSTSF